MVDVVSNGSTLNLNVDNFQYTSFKFVNGDSGTISIEYNFNSTSDVNVTLSYENLSGYANVSTFSGLFNEIVNEENSDNYIKIDLTNATFSDGSNSVTIKGESNTNLIPSQANPDTTKEGKIDEIAFTITPTSTNVTITYTFYIPTSGTGQAGNFRQNLGKYLKAFKDTKGNYTDVTKFISTVVAAS